METVSLAALVDCARMFAGLLREPVPAEADILNAIARILGRNDLNANARDNVITESEAVSYLLAHLQSDLFPNSLTRRDDAPWDDPELIAKARLGIFGR
jgi:hypothetical protein